ncbi:MAG: oxidoreductase [Lysobacterales bacterium]|nr:Gamma-glutamylputrescine oxidoreductase [Xanthomonadales bacterium]
MHAETWYRATRREPDDHPPLAGRTRARVLVVGGGYAGLATALGLAERGIDDVLLLEQHAIGHGASGRNGGFVFGGYSLGEAALRARVGDDCARWMYGLSTAAVRTLRERIRRYEIACDPVDAGVIWANWFDDPEVLDQRRRLLAEHFGVHWQPIAPDRLREQLLTSRYHGGLFEADAFHLHPLNLALGLARAARAQGVRVHCGDAVVSIQREGHEWRVRTASAEVRAAQVVVAGGGYLGGLLPKLRRALLPIATYVAVTEPLGERLGEAIRTRAAVYDTRFAFDYYRALPDTRLLWGGRISILERSPAAVARLLRRDIAGVYPQLGEVRIDYAWSGLMSYARHEMPQIGQLRPGLWYAQAFGGHGVATTSAAGELLAQAIAGENDDWRRFAPFGLTRTWRPFGYLGAQATYSWLQARDRWKERDTGRGARGTGETGRAS